MSDQFLRKVFKLFDYLTSRSSSLLALILSCVYSFVELMHVVCRMRNSLLFRQLKIEWLFAYSINFSSLYSLVLNRF